MTSLPAGPVSYMLLAICVSRSSRRRPGGSSGMASADSVSTQSGSVDDVRGVAVPAASGCLARAQQVSKEAFHVRVRLTQHWPIRRRDGR